MSRLRLVRPVLWGLPLALPPPRHLLLAVMQPRRAATGERSVAWRLALRLLTLLRAAVAAAPLLVAVACLVLLLPVALRLFLRFAPGCLSSGGERVRAS